MRSWRVPFWISGEITITTDGDPGAIGVRESVPKTIKIPAVPLLPLVFPWLALVGCVLALKRNRHARAWLGMLPFMAIWGVLNGLGNASLVEFNSEVATGMYLSLALGLSVLWLLAPVMEGRPRAFKIGLQWGTILVASLGCLAVCDPEKAARSVWILYCLEGVAATTFLLAGHLSAYLCRRNWRWNQFTGSMLGVQFGICYALLVGIGMATATPATTYLRVGLSLALTATGLLLPFLFLGYFSASCRQRWESLFGLAPETPKMEV